MNALKQATTLAATVAALYSPMASATHAPEHCTTQSFVYRTPDANDHVGVMKACIEIPRTQYDIDGSPMGTKSFHPETEMKPSISLFVTDGRTGKPLPVSGYEGAVYASPYSTIGDKTDDQSIFTFHKTTTTPAVLQAHPALGGPYVVIQQTGAKVPTDAADHPGEWIVYVAGAAGPDHPFIFDLSNLDVGLPARQRVTGARQAIVHAGELPNLAYAAISVAPTPIQAAYNDALGQQYNKFPTVVAPAGSRLTGPRYGREIRFEETDVMQLRQGTWAIRPTPDLGLLSHSGVVDSPNLDHGQQAPDFAGSVGSLQLREKHYLCGVTRTGGSTDRPEFEAGPVTTCHRVHDDTKFTVKYIPGRRVTNRTRVGDITAPQHTLDSHGRAINVYEPSVHGGFPPADNIAAMVSVLERPHFVDADGDRVVDPGEIRWEPAAIRSRGVIVHPRDPTGAIVGAALGGFAAGFATGFLIPDGSSTNVPVYVPVGTGGGDGTTTTGTTDTTGTTTTTTTGAGNGGLGISGQPVGR